MAKKLTSAKAKKILHDKSVHGKPLTDKQRKFFGAVASGVIKAQNGIEGTMGGLTDIGFDYNGAWGGTMQMGGSLPGATGMMYARVGAPSNGPYAKKTKASAQNGMEMKYYQEGLDFKPKTISQDGSKTSKGRQPKKVVVFVERPEDWYMFESPEATTPTLKKKDEFVKEAENLKSFYKKTSPNTKVEILPVYNDEVNEYGFLTNKTKSDIYKKLSELTPDDDVFVFGHHGSKYAGIPVQQWASMLESSDYGNCYLGSCNSEDVASGAWKDVRNLKYRPSGEWLGVNPNATNIIDAMFSRSSDPDKMHTVNEAGIVTGFPSKIVKPVKGAEYSERKGPVTPQLAKYAQYARMLTDISQQQNDPSTNLPMHDLGIPYITVPPSKKKKEHGGWLSKYQEGGIIEDPMGQWAHPGEITRIPSNEITMQGVPYPVMGISDTGDTQMMQPGQDYTFDGSSVTEIPMMQNGGLMSYREPMLRAKDRFMEKQLSKFGDPRFVNRTLEIAEKEGYNYGEDSEGPLDAIRHAAMSASVARNLKVPKVVGKYAPALDDAIRMGAANLMGLGYELYNFNPEGFWMDIKNNYIGSDVGVMKNLTDEQRAKRIASMLKSDKLSVNNPNKKKKENGGWLSKYE